MTKQTVIPAGYRLTVTSWENDADNYNTEVKEGLSLGACRLYVDLCKLMGDDDAGVANMYDPDEGELAKLEQELVKVARRHPEETPSLEDGFTESDIADTMTDILYDLGLTGSDFHTRVCSDWKVEHILTDIILTNVTEEFV